MRYLWYSSKLQGINDSKQAYNSIALRNIPALIEMIFLPKLTYTLTNTQTDMHTHTHTDTQTHTHTYTDTHTYIHKHTYPHTYTNI